MARQFPALRGIAIVLVVLNHSIAIGGSWVLKLGFPIATGWEHLALVFLHRLGFLAVPIFFFISGSFVVYMARGNPPSPPWPSIKALLKRVLFPFLFWSLVFYILVYSRFSEPSTVVDYVKRLVSRYPYHFIPLLVFYYLCSPVLFAFARRSGLLLVAAAAIIQVFCIATVLPDTLGSLSLDWLYANGIPTFMFRTFALWGIFFPLGLVYGINTKGILPWLKKFKWVFLGSTVLLFVLEILDEASIVNFKGATYIYPVTFLFLIPLIDRNSIPWVHYFEELGKRSYGLYLAHPVVIELILFTVQAFMPGLFNYKIIFFPLIVLSAGLCVPLLAMDALSRATMRNVYRIVFG